MKYSLIRFIVLLNLAFVGMMPINAIASDKVPIGLITALTGPFATIGSAVRNGIQLAIIEHPEKFSSLQLIVEDDQLEARNGVTAFRKLTTQDNAQMVFVFGGPSAHAIAPIAERNKVLLIAVCFPSEFAVGRNYVFRSMNPTAHYAEALVHYLSSQGVTRFEVLRSDNIFFQSFADEIKKALSSDQEYREIALISPQDVDLKTFLNRITPNEESYLGLLLSPHHLSSFAKLSNPNVRKKIFYGTDLFESLPSSQSKAFEGAIYPDNQVTESFRHRYMKHFGNDNHLTLAASAYDVAFLIARAIQETQTTSPEKIVYFAKQTKGQLGELGKFNFRESSEYGMFMEYDVVIKKLATEVINTAAGE